MMRLRAKRCELARSEAQRGRRRLAQRTGVRTIRSGTRLVLAIGGRLDHEGVWDSIETRNVLKRSSRDGSDLGGHFASRTGATHSIDAAGELRRAGGLRNNL